LVAGSGATAGLCGAMPLLGAALARAVSAVCSAMSRVTELQAGEHWVTDLSRYIEATASTLTRVRGISGTGAEGVDEELCRAAERVAELLERLDCLVEGYARHCTARKAVEIVTFHQQREEIMGALGLWNASVTQVLQVLQQQALAQQQVTLDAIATEVRALAAAARMRAGEQVA